MRLYKILLLCLVFLLLPVGHLLYFQDATITDVVQPSISPIAAIIYFSTIRKKRFFFTLFIILFSFTDFLNLFKPLYPHFFKYFVINTMFTVAYVCLLIEILRSLNFSVIIKRFKIPVLILLGLSIYVIGALQTITDIIDEQYFMELSYNTSVILVLSASVLNYFYYYDKKTFLLLVGSFLMVIQECIAIGYLYINERTLTYILWCIFTILPFYFFIAQAGLTHKERNPIIGN